MHFPQYVPRFPVRRATSTAAAILVLALVLALVAAFTFSSDTRFYATDTASTAVTTAHEDVVSQLAATGATVVAKTTDASIAIASKIVTDSGIIANYATTPAGIMTTGGLLLLAAIGALYLSKTSTGHLRRLRRICTPTARSLVRSATFLRSHGGEAYARSIAVLAQAHGPSSASPARA